MLNIYIYINKHKVYLKSSAIKIRLKPDKCSIILLYVLLELGLWEDSNRVDVKINDL